MSQPLKHFVSSKCLPGCSLCLLSRFVCAYACGFFSSVPLESSLCSVLFNVRMIAVITKGSWGMRKELGERWPPRQPSALGGTGGAGCQVTAPGTRLLIGCL